MVLIISFSIIKDRVYTSIFIYIIVSINLKFANNLDLLVVISQVSTIIKLQEVWNSYRADLTILGSS